MSIPSLKTEQGTLIDYDLNIYHLEEEVGRVEVLDGIGDPIYEYTDQWYVDIYEYTTNQYGASQQTHVTGPYKISSKQRDLLELGTGGYFTDDDSWYGLWGFLEDYSDKLLPELSDILDALPKYKEELLF